MSDAAKFAQQYAQGVGRVKQQELDNRMRAERVQGLQNLMMAGASIAGQMKADKSANELATQYGLGKDGNPYTGGEAGLDRELRLMKAKQGLLQDDAQTELLKAQTGLYGAKSANVGVGSPGRPSAADSDLDRLTRLTDLVANGEAQLADPNLDPVSKRSLQLRVQFGKEMLAKQGRATGLEPEGTYTGADGVTYKGSASQIAELVKRDKETAPTTGEKKSFWPSWWPNFGDSAGGTPKAAASPVDSYPDGTVRIGNQSGRYEQKVSGRWAPYTP